MRSWRASGPLKTADPDISLAAAYYQEGRVTANRHLPLEQAQSLIVQHTRRPWLGFLGEPRVNVLELNLAIDAPRS
jgi:K+-transporting ATPase ATPase C chain